MPTPHVHLGNTTVVLSETELDACLHVLKAVLERKYDEDGGGDPIRSVFDGFAELRTAAVRAQARIQKARDDSVARATGKR